MTIKNGDKPSKSEKIKHEIFSWVKTIIIAIIIAFGANTFIIVNAKVPTGSMENTIMSNDRIIASRLAYKIGEPERGDIAVFRYPDDKRILYVKRIIGIPGDTVIMMDGVTYVNGEMIDEPYLKEDAYGTYGPFIVPEDSYFMMGDNRNLSWDSRFWENTFVDEADILGKGIFRYFPNLKKLN